MEGYRSVKTFKQIQEERKRGDERRITLSEATLNRVMGVHFQTGFIIITAFRDYRDISENFALFKELKNDIANAHYGFIPVYGGYQETDKDTGELVEVEEPSLLVPNRDWDRGQKPREDDNLKEFGTMLCGKYDQESFMYKPKGSDDTAYFVDRNGKVVESMFTTTINDATRKYFTKLHNNKNREDRRFTTLTQYDDPKKEKPEYTGRSIFKFNRKPANVSEAVTRRGELFYNFKEDE
jgi:hypothetical protein